MQEDYLKIPLDCNRIMLTRQLSHDKLMFTLHYTMTDGSTSQQPLRIGDAQQRFEFEKMFETLWTLVSEGDDYKIYQRNY